MSINLYIVIFIFLTGSFFPKVAGPGSDLHPDTPVAESLFALGYPRPAHYQPDMTSEMIQRGEELVKTGRTIGPDGSRSSYISKYYVCTSCHNTKREDITLTSVNQEERLQYAIENNLPYIQGSTFWGVVNREQWYNDDYEKKYGELVIKAKKSLSESIKLCATVCSQGRSLEDWELESIISYLWTLQMNMSDLNLSENEWNKLRDSEVPSTTKIELIKSNYLQNSPATFVDPPDNLKKGYPYKGNPKLGKAIYELGCQHCHRPGGESDVVFDNTQLSLNWLKRHIPENSQKSIYHIIRKGTYAEYGHKEYMPHYTAEKMSDQQVEHLRAYIKSGD